MPDIYNLFMGGVGAELTIQQFLLNTFSALLFGMVVSYIYRYRNKHSRTMALTLVVLPAMVQVIIMLVSGNIGAGVAVAGAFSLVRFRSATGNARDIGYLFFAMVLGFITGMGFLIYAFLFMIIVGCVFVVMARLGHSEETRTLRVTIPENLNFDGLFDDVFKKFAHSCELDTVKSTNMGSLYELTFTVALKDAGSVKPFIDELRIRNGNLNVFLSRSLEGSEGL